MPVTTILIAFLLAAVAIEAVLRRGRERSGWVSFGGWTVAGFLSALATISFAIGLLVLPFAIVAILTVSRFAIWPGAVGFIGGAGLIGVLLWAVNIGDPGPDYYSWLAVGVGLAAASVVAFAALTTSPTRRPPHPRTR